MQRKYSLQHNYTDEPEITEESGNDSMEPIRLSPKSPSTPHSLNKIPQVVISEPVRTHTLLELTQPPKDLKEPRSASKPPAVSSSLNPTDTLSKGSFRRWSLTNLQECYQPSTVFHSGFTPPSEGLPRVKSHSDASSMLSPQSGSSSSERHRKNSWSSPFGGSLFSSSKQRSQEKPLDLNHLTEEEQEELKKIYVY